MESKPSYEELEQRVRELEKTSRETDRHTLELLQSVSLHQAITDTSGEGFFIADLDSRLLEVNDAYVKRSGYSREELLCMRIVDLEAVESEQETLQRVRKISKLGSARFETMHCTKGGEAWPAEINISYWDAYGGRLFIFIHDISERKAAEEALRESERQYRLLADNVTDAIWTMGLDFHLKYYSPSFLALHGYSVGEEFEPDLLKLLTEESYRLTLQAFAEEVLRDGNAGVPADRAILLELDAVRRDGTVVPIEARASFMRDGRGAATGIIGISRDISERKKLEAQLTQAQKMESIGLLAGGVAHDINNKLCVILGNAELVLEDMDPQDAMRRHLEVIKQAGNQSADITRQLLAFARQQAIQPRVLDLNETVSGVLRMLGRLIGEDIELSWIPGEDLSPVKVDPTQVDQILANLCVNARDAIEGTGRLTIETANVTLDEAYCAGKLGFIPGDYVQLVVSDDGCGMDSKVLEHVFEPFFTTKASGKGTGLGLATVYGIVKQNSGFINVYSEPEQGTSIRIYLPPFKGGTLDQRVAAEAPLARGGDETILVVEDDHAILEMIRMMLEPFGYKVVTAGAPVRALELARELGTGIDLLVTDVIMPDMNGRQLASRLREEFPNLRTLFMSGYTADVIAHHGVLDEGVQFISKPFSIEDLARRVRVVLDWEG